MRLFIAEKPSLARAIADALPGPHQRNADHIVCGQGNVVGWCVGHILETAKPEEYSPDYKAWRLDHLPIVPATWRLVPSKPELLKALARLLKGAKSVVHAGDPDREGQLLVDEVLAFLGYNGPVQRLLVTDLNLDAVRKALGTMEPNARYRPLSDAGLARQRADWLYGMNMTRLYTLLGRNGGYAGVLSVGRVQTPLLGLIVRRDLEIEAFVPVPYFVLRATLETPAGSFHAFWAPSDPYAQHLDNERRLLHRPSAEEVQRRARGHIATVTRHTAEKKSEPPPLPYSLSDLQIDAGRQLGATAQEVLDACQRLYETHRLITYPRSDCTHLPEAHFVEASTVMRAIRGQAAELSPLVANAQLSFRSRAWNDKQVTAHHAIIPTPRQGKAALGDLDQAIYDLIARRYIAQFYGPFEFLQTKLELELAGEPWKASGRRILAEGWRSTVRPASSAADEAEASERDERDSAPLPALKEGDHARTRAVDILDKRTTPPKPFTDATLIQAMHNIAAFVADPEVKKVLRATDGIGTEATRATIIETLFARHFVVRVKKTVRSTPAGRDLVRALPQVATTPDMTARWEQAMERIAEGAQSVTGFLTPVQAELGELVTAGRRLEQLAIGEVHRCTRPNCGGTLRRIKGQHGFFWSCRVCRATADDAKGRPAIPGRTTPAKPRSSPRPAFPTSHGKKTKESRRRRSNGEAR